MKLTRTQRTALWRNFLLSKLPEEARAGFLSGHEPVCFSKGEVIFSPHHFSRALGILLEGEAVVRKESGAVLNLLRPGDCFGAAALFVEKDTYVTTIQSRSRSAVLFLSGEELAAYFRQYPEMALAYIAFLSGRIQFLNEKIDSFTSPTAEDAIFNWVLTHADDEGRATVSGGLAALARTLNISRASLYRGLGRLEEEGRIVRTGTEIKL